MKRSFKKRWTMAVTWQDGSKTKTDLVSTFDSKEAADWMLFWPERKVKVENCLVLS